MSDPSTVMTAEERDRRRRRLIEICWFQFRHRLPDVLSKLKTTLDEAKALKKASQVEKSRYIASTLLSDTRLALAFGYPFGRETRLSLAKGMASGTENGGSFLPGEVLREIMLVRTEYYLQLTRVALELVIAYAEESTERDIAKTWFDQIVELKESLKAFSFRGNETIERIGYAVKMARDDQKLLEEGLLLARRTRLLDPALEAAVWWISLQSSAANEHAVVQFVTRQVNRGPADVADPNIFLWALLELKKRNAPDVNWTLMPGLIRSLIGNSRPDPEKLASASMEMPEAYSSPHRSWCFCLYDLSELARLTDGDVRDAVMKLRDDYEEKVINHFWLEPRPTNGQKAAEPKQLLDNLHITSQLLHALAAREGPELKLPRISLDLPTLLHHTDEINLAEHVAFGEYLLWSGSDSTFEQRAKDLTKQVAHHRSHDMQRPLNIFLAGDPGAGKSYFVKNFISEAFGGKNIPKIEINAGQLSDPSEIRVRLAEATGMIAQHGIAVIFVDEADTNINGRYLFPQLIGPMWDGVIDIDGRRSYMKKAICFFAFSQTSDEKAAEAFCTSGDGATQKGRDFWSRLQIRTSVPPLSNEGRLLVFCSNLKRYVGKQYVRREVLRRVVEARSLTPRHIENGLSVTLLGDEDQCVDAAAVAAWLPAGCIARHPPPDGHSDPDQEWVAIIDA